jgi:hypothetical protein
MKEQEKMTCFLPEIVLVWAECIYLEPIPASMSKTRPPRLIWKKWSLKKGADAATADEDVCVSGFDLKIWKERTKNNSGI